MLLELGERVLHLEYEISHASQLHKKCRGKNSEKQYFKEFLLSQTDEWQTSVFSIDPSHTVGWSIRPWYFFVFAIGMKITEVVDQVVWQVVDEKEEEGVINKMGQIVLLVAKYMTIFHLYFCTWTLRTCTNPKKLSLMPHKMFKGHIVHIKPFWRLMNIRQCLWNGCV